MKHLIDRVDQADISKIENRDESFFRTLKIGPMRIYGSRAAMFYILAVIAILSSVALAYVITDAIAYSIYR